MSSSSDIIMRDSTDFINRAFKGSGELQWVREVLVNSVEGNATKIEFGVEWESVKKEGVYRRIISDNGDGMTANELAEYFRHIGESGSKKDKILSAMDRSVHANFGIGCRVSLLPFNKKGVVYISYKNGKGAMIWMWFNEEDGKYQIKPFETETGLEYVIDPDEVNWEEDEINWNKVVPEWIRGNWSPDGNNPPQPNAHGTCVILMGDDLKTHTFIEAEEGLDLKPIRTNKALTKYINSRFIDLRHNGDKELEVRALEFNFGDPSEWPKNEHDISASIPGKNRTSRATWRTCHGALYYIREALPQKPKEGKLKAEGTVIVEDDRLKIHWYLWEGDRTQCDTYAMDIGYVAIKYKTELFGVNSTYRVPIFRNFGIYDKTIRDKLTIILEPKYHYEDSQWGIFPDQNRSRLMFCGNGSKCAEIPLSDWGLLFLKNMPPEIDKVIKESQKDDIEGEFSEKLIKRLLNKLGDRFHSIISVVDPRKGRPEKTGEIDSKNSEQVSVFFDEKGKLNTNKGDSFQIKKGDDQDNPEHHPHKPDPESVLVQRKLYEVLPGKEKIKRRILLKKILPGSTGKTPTMDIETKLDCPRLLCVGKDKMNEQYPWHVCSYAENYPTENGILPNVVLLNIDAPLIVSSVKYHQSHHHEEYHDKIRNIVHQMYGLHLCTVVAQILNEIPKEIPKEDVKNLYLGEPALMTASSGLAAVDAMITPRLGEFGPKRSESAAA